MLFNSISYLIFFPIVLALYWVMPRSWRKPLLLVASYVFYMSWIPIYGVLIFLLSIFNYLLAIAIDKLRGAAKALFVFGIVANVATLCYYKYTSFLVESFVNAINATAPFLHMPVRAEMPLVDVLLPLGISFFAFEFIHYLSDVYKGGRPIYGVIDFGLFAAFFPSQIAGPIKRYQDFIEQLKVPATFSGAMFNEGLAMFLQGLFKKVAIADNLMPLVNAGYAHTATLGTADAWIAVVGFAVEVYCDFSGYTDMGRGSGMMLGYTLPSNFNFPYLSGSFSEFWRRWHISLSTWLRDYVYIPMGGARAGKLAKYRNLVLTMAIGGLWHGAAWHYVIWGFLSGFALVINHEYNNVVQRTKWLQVVHTSTAAKAFCIFLTFFFVATSFVLFRADSVPHGMEMYAALFSYRPSSCVVDLLPPNTIVVSLLVYALYATIYALPDFKSFPRLEKLRQRLTPSAVPARAIIYAAVALGAIGFSPSAPSPFIYFQF